MKRTILLLGLLSVLFGCSGDAAKTADAGKSDSSATTADGKKDAPKKPEVVRTVDPKTGMVTEKTKDGTSESTIDPKTGLGVIKSVDKYKKPFTLDRTGNVPLSEVGLPEYPGGQIPPKQPKVMKITAYGGWEWGMVRTTSDTPEKVIAFYKSKIQKPEEEKSDGRIMIKGAKPNGDKVTVIASRNPKNDKETMISVQVRRRDPNVKAPPKEEGDKPAKDQSGIAKKPPVTGPVTPPKMPAGPPKVVTDTDPGSKSPTTKVDTGGN
ncbi:MAG TPA: hypothetical protein PLL78_00935 [Fimbriimonadaceae bacterium]|nr:hypothetical protein [Fimbriimonadaceae bacterium]HRJ95227.1 hypothetical protein [Fimbriimonadaceae bacterium]